MQQKLTSSRSREIDRTIFSCSTRCVRSCDGIQSLTRWSSSRSNLVYLLDAIRILILDERGDVGPLVLLPLVGVLLELVAASAVVAVCSVWVVVVE